MKKLLLLASSLVFNNTFADVPAPIVFDGETAVGQAIEDGWYSQHYGQLVGAYDSLIWYLAHNLGEQENIKTFDNAGTAMTVQMKKLSYLTVRAINALKACQANLQPLAKTDAKKIIDQTNTDNTTTACNTCDTTIDNTPDTTQDATRTTPQDAAQDLTQDTTPATAATV